MNLVEILKDVPKGTALYSPVCGECTLYDVDEKFVYSIMVAVTGISYDDGVVVLESFTNEGLYMDNRPGGECLLFPSKEQRDWSKFGVKGDAERVILHPFDRVLVRNRKEDTWWIEFFERIDNENSVPYFITLRARYAECIPYNEETAELLGTSDKPKREYLIEFDKSFKE